MRSVAPRVPPELPGLDELRNATISAFGLGTSTRPLRGRGSARHAYVARHGGARSLARFANGGPSRRVPVDRTGYNAPSCDRRATSTRNVRNASTSFAPIASSSRVRRRCCARVRASANPGRELVTENVRTARGFDRSGDLLLRSAAARPWPSSPRRPSPTTRVSRIGLRLGRQRRVRGCTPRVAARASARVRPRRSWRRQACGGAGRRRRLDAVGGKGKASVPGPTDRGRGWVPGQCRGSQR